MSPRCCFWVSTEQPRMLFDRHDDGCPGENCRGCLPCPKPLCLGCYREHDDHVCPGCLTDVRETLTEIGRMVAALPAEVRAKGIDSEAMNLLGPAADAESLGHMQASINVGRIPEDWLEVADNELHPLLVAGGWMQAYLEAFNHDEPARITVTGALSYLTRNLDHIGTEDDIPFRDFRRDLAACRAHMERVLHDGEQVETGAPCMTCERPLLRVYEGGMLPWSYRDGARPIASTDGWACRRCREFRSEKDYRLNVAELHTDHADWLTDQQMQVRTGVKSATVRSWARDGGPVRSRRDSGRTVYAVEDVERTAREKGLVA